MGVSFSAALRVALGVHTTEVLIWRSILCGNFALNTDILYHFCPQTLEALSCHLSRLRRCNNYWCHMAHCGFLWDHTPVLDV